MAMNDDQLKAMISREIKNARSNDDSVLSAERRQALEYFNGEMNDLPAEKGRSSVVSRDVADAVGWMLPQAMRVFLASDRMVIAEPVGDEDEQQASEATELLNFVFLKDNPGYRILRDATWDAMVLRNGIIKVWHDDTPRYSTSFHSNLSDEELAVFEADKNVEITHQTTSEETFEVDDGTGNLVPMTIDVHEIKVKRLKSTGRRVIECIPPEDYLRSDEPPSVERPRFEAHRSRVTKSDLIKDGYDRKTVMDLGVATDEDAEDHSRGEYHNDDDPSDKSMEEVDKYECYIQVDVDDDGIAEVVRAICAGDKGTGALLAWEVWEDEGPFFDIPCDPIPHRWDAKSIADETMDMQKVKTALWRQAMDNTYASNNPRNFVMGELVNPDELFSPTFGGALFGKPGASVTPLPVPFVANHAYEALTYADEVIQRRTGVGRQSMALDPEALQNQSATANQNNKDAAYTQVEQMVRDMAELGWTPIFRALLKLEIRHQDRARNIRLGKKSTRVDPRYWNADMDITMDVGLGTGSRDRDMAMLQNVLGTQLALADRLLAQGATNEAIQMLPKIIDTMVKIAESAGLRNPKSFYPDNADEMVKRLEVLAAQRAGQPDPKVQIEQAKIAADQQRAQGQMQIDQQKAAGNLELERAKAEADMQLKREQLAGELQLKREQLAAELQLKREQVAAELELKRQLGVLNAAASSVSTTEVHPGGEPG